MLSRVNFLDCISKSLRSWIMVGFSGGIARQGRFVAGTWYLGVLIPVPALNLNLS